MVSAWIQLEYSDFRSTTILLRWSHLNQQINQLDHTIKFGLMMNSFPFLLLIWSIYEEQMVSHTSYRSWVNVHCICVRVSIGCDVGISFSIISIEPLLSSSRRQANILPFGHNLCEWTHTVDCRCRTWYVAYALYKLLRSSNDIHIVLQLADRYIAIFAQNPMDAVKHEHHIYRTKRARIVRCCVCCAIKTTPCCRKNIFSCHLRFRLSQRMVG